MNIRISLAGALLLTSSAARAQFLDVVCLPADAACQRSFMTGPGAADPTETIAAYNPFADAKWASDTCQHIPCKIAEVNEPAPLDAEGFQKELADKIQAAGNIDSRAKPLNNDDAKQEAARLGAEFADDQNHLAASASASSVENSKTAAATPGRTVAVDNSEARPQTSQPDYTYIKIREAAKNGKSIIEGGAATFHPADAPGRAVEPPVDEKYLGKIQVVPNE